MLPIFGQEGAFQNNEQHIKRWTMRRIYGIDIQASYESGPSLAGGLTISFINLFLPSSFPENASYGHTLLGGLNITITYFLLNPTKNLLRQSSQSRFFQLAEDKLHRELIGFFRFTLHSLPLCRGG